MTPTSAEHGFSDSVGEWPFVGLDVGAMSRAGWAPTPFRQFVLKLHSRCNLSCDYCYMYEMSDQSWSKTPLVMSPTVVAQAARRIGDHVRRHELTRVQVVLHGGEPLLAGSAALADVAVAVRAALPHKTALDLRVQTNGTLLDIAMLDVFARHGIRVGVSIDGDQSTHDRHRGRPDGRGSYTATVRALELLRRPEYSDLYAGLLCVVDLTADPILTYDSLLAFGPPVINFLLPHGNWSMPPLPQRTETGETPYGDWLVAAFDRWYRTPRRETEVRLFAEIMNLLLGGQSRSETVGLSPAALITINTDGSIEQVDTLRSAYEGAVRTDHNVVADSFDAVLRHPAVAARQIGVAALSDTCRACDIHRICGSGYYPHRYRRGHGFRNPSVYCRDLTLLIKHIRSRVNADLAALRAEQAGPIRSPAARCRTQPAEDPWPPASPGDAGPAAG